ncbi:D-threo-aldose 1-dehydrogenase [Rhodovulum imhoffii]|uniref:D-threo-aldose 1-dehydrogenase n=1 Tax=Rhodovulum imhoffii TaxID=365340 RepID=A0A2T5BUH2_9RHOB|nr:aldo/keto reductase [Rhodovulum imhoffii]MBK5934773.1 pyridoxal 4-dehydrogenase [Rhodovulum imhoffii]PTN03174.1 D-threo-aldose 1-dehydrogenase [Rhodovulum imhoffii]
MQPDSKVKFGRADLKVTPFGFGTAPIGNIFREIDEETSDAMFQEAWAQGVRYFDTAPMYGHGLSELRTGHSLRWKNRDDFVLSSKVGRILKSARKKDIDYAPWTNAGRFTMHFDYSYDGTMRSVEDSLQRLNLERMDICFIHDIDVFTRGDEQPEVFKQAMDGSWKALSDLRDQGVVRAIGVGVNEWEVCHAALQQRDFDCFLLAGRYTLLEQDALNEFLPLCEDRGAAVVVGGGFNSGILATGAKEGAKYNYAPAPDDVMAKVQRIEEVCKEYGVPLPAAALQFVVAHPAVPTFMAGTRTVEQLQQNIAWFSHPIPDQFWADLKTKGLLREDAPTP